MKQDLKYLLEGCKQASRMAYTLKLIELNNASNRILANKVTAILSEEKQKQLSRQYDQVLYQIMKHKRLLNKLEEN